MKRFFFHLVFLIAFIKITEGKNKSNLDSLLLVYENAVTINDSLTQAKVSYQISKIYYNQYQDSAAAFFNVKSIDLFKATNQIRLLAIAQNQYGILLSDMGKNLEAIQQ